MEEQVRISYNPLRMQESWFGAIMGFLFLVFIFVGLTDFAGESCGEWCEKPYGLSFLQIFLIPILFPAFWIPYYGFILGLVFYPLIGFILGWLVHILTKKPKK